MITKGSNKGLCAGTLKDMGFPTFDKKHFLLLNVYHAHKNYLLGL